MRSFSLGKNMPTQHQPLIAITSSLITNKAGSLVCQLGKAYVNAITQAGGIPLVIPVGTSTNDLPNCLDRVDGIMLSGGGDISIERFNGAPHPRVYGVEPERDELELKLLNYALKRDMPLLAICRGVQVLNIAFGGDLYTHIQDQKEQSLKHDWFPKFPRDKLAHTVRLQPGSQLHQIFGQDEIRVNSLHHQGINRVGKGLKATAFAPDGVVEGLEVQGVRFALGVQWHPECLPNDPGMQKLFRAFVNACSIVD
jgi:putative glutamine amidotransferase